MVSVSVVSCHVAALSCLIQRAESRFHRISSWIQVSTPNNGRGGRLSRTEALLATELVYSSGTVCSNRIMVLLLERSLKIGLEMVAAPQCQDGKSARFMHVSWLTKVHAARVGLAGEDHLGEGRETGTSESAKLPSDGVGLPWIKYSGHARFSSGKMQCHRHFPQIR